MSSICIIPARGGSKRIPRKNIKNFHGKPIIAYSIEIAVKSGLFDEVMVSTDDIEIAEIAKKYGANVPFLRSKKNSDDFATTVVVLREVLDRYERELNLVYENACCIYATSPLISIDKLHRGFMLLRDEGYKTVISVAQFCYPIWRGLRGQDNRVDFIWSEYKNVRSQDLPITYHDAGQWYWFKPVMLIDSLISDNTGFVVLSDVEMQDIDTEHDWTLAELKYSILNNEEKGLF